MTIETKKPNFLIIVADDLGFTDTSPFGGEITTPNLQKLAQNGLRFTQFHTASACSPTRSMLFSGTDNHIAGLGQMAEFIREVPELLNGKPGYEGYLNDRVATLPQILQDGADYYTFISGKWHLGLAKGQWPIDRGFEKSFTLLPGAGNHYKYFPKEEDGKTPISFMNPVYVENDKLLNEDTDLPADFYSTDYFTDKALEFLDSSDRKGRPFFASLTYTAPHWPFQAPEEVIEKYKGRYDEGPAVLRKKRLARALELGIIPQGVEPHQVETFREKPWAELTNDEKKIEAKIMEIYAAMVEILDKNVGRLVDKLEKSGELDNTFILFMSDNGAEGMFMEAMPLRVENINRNIEKYYNNDFDNIGKKDSFVWYSDQWAQAATAPSYMYKMWASEGGIRTPLIVSYPGLGNHAEIKGKVVDEFVTVMDILPTVLQLADVKHPGTLFRGRKVVEPRGKSWADYLLGTSDHVHDEETVTGWELFGQQAVRKGNFKALYIPKPYGTGKWQLFDLSKDLGEVHDLAKTNKDKLDELLNHWTQYVAETGLVEVGSKVLGTGLPEEGGYTVIPDDY
ncbi:hypothetical protein CANARDRAFT_8016 [[Candida] arabinofermentans NRRL YB-2248]|uniref:Sulfatase N-terminal domain-containing protein n=1 Tax=[Candida] arabinofermentans NRRL YB-2248 TaxID=983967 RepID=A0A1E4SZF5_9ASCO|nr:hypothetical protein CANARDRAFT_8016 [[Candida] arabinofermentans NRRL YB-2248]